MRRLIFMALALLVLTPPGRAVAHGLGVSTDLPLPLWVSLYGAAVVVLISFVAIGLFGDLFVGADYAPRRYHRGNLLRIEPLRAVLTNGLFLLGLRLLSVALFLLVILSGLLGRQDSGYNFAPTFVWITWWVGFSFFTAFVGNIWPLVSPWKILFEWAEGVARWLGAKRGLELSVPYPALLGVWPALALFALFIWVENVFEGSATPLNIAFFAILYSILTWIGMVVFDKEVWLRKGEAFSVFFGILAKFAPTEVRVSDPKLCKECSGSCQTVEGGCVNCYECFARAAPGDRELNLRFPAVGLRSAEQATPDRLVFIVFMLASVTYDGLIVTPFGVELQRLISKTLGLVAVPLLFLAVYLGFVKLCQLFGGRRGSFGQFAATYVYSLLPIAIAYQVAHYSSYLLIQGQAIIHYLSDPFGCGWNLFGTANYEINAGLIGASSVWKLQVTLIVIGHVIAVYLAHVVALRSLRNPKLAMRSQYPMIVLMIFYTVFSLWILSQPVVEKYKVAAQTDGNSASAIISTIVP